MLSFLVVRKKRPDKSVVEVRATFVNLRQFHIGNRVKVTILTERWRWQPRQSTTSLSQGLNFRSLNGSVTRQALSLSPEV